jgi:hypothetical protein
MNERQAYALANPITDPGDTAQAAQVHRNLRATRRHACGLLLMSILAVDR